MYFHHMILFLLMTSKENHKEEFILLTFFCKTFTKTTRNKTTNKIRKVNALIIKLNNLIDFVRIFNLPPKRKRESGN